MSAERLLMGLLLGGIGLGCAVVIMPFLSAILWAAILVYSTWPVFCWLDRRARLGRTGAAAAMVVLTAVLVILPLLLAASSGVEDAAGFAAQVQALVGDKLATAPDWVRALPLVGDTVATTWDSWSADLRPVREIVRPYFGLIAESGLSVLLSVAGGVLQAVLALFIAFFVWVSGETLAAHGQALVRRICGNTADRLITVTGNTVRGTVYGVLGTAFVQAVLTGLGLWITGVPRPLLLALITGFLSVLPIGAPVVWVPAALWLIASGHLGLGVFLAAYGVLAISGSDNLIRPMFIARGAKLPFLLTILGVLGGALAFGLLGIFVGPVLLGVGFTLVAEFARPAEPA